MDEGNLNSDLRSVPALRNLSVIAAASHLCQHLNIKNKIKEFLDDHYPVWRTKTPHDQYRELLRGEYLKQLLHEISSIFWKMLNQWKIPQILKLEVHDKALELTERIHDWMLHLIYDLDLDRRYIKKIFLTAQGEIDVDKIFKSHWMIIPMKKPMKRSFFDKRITMLHYLACAFFQEEFIITNQAKIMTEINSIKFRPEVEDNDAVSRIMKHVMYMLENRDRLLILIRPTLQLKLLDICTSFGFYKPFIYFWNRCNDSQKLNYLEKISSYESWIDIKCRLKAHYAADNLFKIIIFLIDQMNEPEKNQSIANFAKSFYFCLGESKCWKKFCIRIVDRYLPIISESEGEETFLKKVFEIFDVSLLKTVMNHDVYKRRKNYVLNFGQEKYEKLILYKDFESLNEFLDNVFKTEHEKNNFKKEFNFLQELIYKYRLKRVDEVLNWMGTLSKNDKRDLIVEEMKNSYRRTKRENEILLQKFLKWYSGTVNEPLISNCEDQASLTGEIIYILWLRFYSRDPVDHISSKILKSVFNKRKKIIIFKKTELVEDVIVVVKLFCDKKLELKRYSEACFSVFEEFLEFCGEHDKIDKVKTSIAHNIREWILQYGVCLRRFDIIMPLLDWVYGSENNNHELLKTYFKKSEKVENYYQNRKL